MTANDDTLVDKRGLRAALRERREAHVAALPGAIRALTFGIAPGPLAALMRRARCVAAYAPLGAEADPLRLLTQAAAMGCETALPHIVSRADPMRFIAWRPGSLLVVGPMGLRQPDAAGREVAPDLILTPLVGFDRRRNRLGQGAGHYDRAFAANPQALRIGVAWSVQEVESLPLEPWDMPLDAVLTEREWLAGPRAEGAEA
ncbi:5-formyltetrahydrofolate cyclo-ligase [Sphingomonas zeicaulis]|uniref:5-formyltetrahydrofolate cyclo-ligase n=1 Tax=Sphingomonas zeicaulis TaxID=1632740 RepID=UPI003D241C47